ACEKSEKFIANRPARRQAHDLAEDMNTGYLQKPSTKRMARRPPRPETPKTNRPAHPPACSNSSI
ncbi:hypothetical protein, partial [Chromobacterium subtsugae]|uniref:hypothetical protein n=1 Tax=Chromobacterium subtsugae TaxID=251747 RepID=UPI001C10F558